MAEVDARGPDRPALLKSRVISQSQHRRFQDVASYVAELGGDKGLAIEKILIANNGVAAIKAIRSIRRWAYEVFGNENAISFVVMATPEDLRANAEYIRMGDVIVDVPGGANNHNYANVTLIVELARLHRVHAVWAGWGHASENPLLPDSLADSNPPIKFIGPSGPPMRALGDKIGSTIIAQTAGVPCIAWNGDAVKAEYDCVRGSLPQDAYDRASIANASEASKAAARIGFPIMIKASEGGGGKGIRKVERAEDVQTAYRQVCGEVPGSPIFIMKLSSNSRHLEVQLIGDEYGNAIALNGRDCSVQRRHQKIIEEGPPIAASEGVWLEMEKAAISLAKAVGYTNAGTVEYLYSEKHSKFYFLELNPRLQVEHPVTEMITGVNLPAAQLQVAMGIPLYNIPDIRELYGQHRFENVPKDPSSIIDFEHKSRLPTTSHCIAVRITAENAEAGFKPTSGGIQELNFRSTHSVWGYFSMDSSGSIHEFADSQFGHLFATGADREQARRSMVLALKELSIRGDISTTVDYISKLIELDDYVGNNFHTGWLDALIKENVDGIGLAEREISRHTEDNSLGDHTYVVIGATVTAFDRCMEGESKFTALLEKGQLPPLSLLAMVHDVELILNGIKYKIKCTRTAPNAFSLAWSKDSSQTLLTSVRMLSDGGYLIDITGKSHVAYLTSRGDVASGMRLSVGGSNVAFSADYDPTSLRTDVAGKLVKKLVPEGAHVKKGEPYGEIEVMKMFMPLKVEEAGTVLWQANEGAALAAGDLIATLTLDNPENVSPVTVFDADFSPSLSSLMRPTGRRPHHVLREALDSIKDGMSGFVLNESALDNSFGDLEKAVTDPLLPVYEIDEQLSVLSGRIPGKLFDVLAALLNEFKTVCRENKSGVQLRFPAEKAVEHLDECSKALDPSERPSFEGLTGKLRETMLPYTKSRASGVPGSERAMLSFLDMLESWTFIERGFSDGRSYADAVEELRNSNKDNPKAVLEVCRAHARVKLTADIVSKIIDIISDASRIDPETSQASPIGKRASIVTGAASLSTAFPRLSEIGALKGSESYSVVALKARKVLLQESMPSVEQRKRKYKEIAFKLSSAHPADASEELKKLLAENLPIEDIIFPLLKQSSSMQEKAGLLELLMRMLYRSYSMRECEKDPDHPMLQFTFQNKPSESAIRRDSVSRASVSDLTRILSSSSEASLANLALSEDDSETSVSTGNTEKIAPLTIRTGVTYLAESIDDFSRPEVYKKISSKFPRDGSIGNGPVNVMYVVVTGVLVNARTEKETALQCESALSVMAKQLEDSGVRRVTFFFDQEQKDHTDYAAPAVYTYRGPEYKEEIISRGTAPTLVFRLDLNRIATNFLVQNHSSRHTSTCFVHMYEAVPKPTALAKDKKANQGPRIFARVLSFALDFSSSSFERLLVDSLNSMDLVALKSKADNHLFVNLVGESSLILDPVVVEQIVVGILKRHGERIARLGIVEVEARIVCSLSQDSPPIALRLVASNPTGYVNVMSTYVEAADDPGGELVFKLIGGTKASLAGSGDNSWEGLNVNTPYPLTRPFDNQRKAALKATDTLYCYDLPALFEAAIEELWAESAKGGKVGLSAASRPLMVMYTTELVVQKIGSESKSWTMQDYQNGDLELVQINRGAGSNDVGMVAWLMVLKTVEYPDGRQVVLIANDITLKAGSFGTREDVVFKLASEYAREHKIPRLFVAANSGARIGLADRVKKAFKVAFKDPSKPENGFSFLYLTKDDYKSLNSGKPVVHGDLTSYNGEAVYRLTDVIGSEPDLGVENLKGSGLIAGETSIAYEDIFTLTIVLGRTVGIGAYLVRLGQRTIQKTTASPIILTGYQALNTLMGVDVYSTNDQLGGPGIMYRNGVSHMTESDHLSAIKAAVSWLSYVPSNRGALVPITDIRGFEDIERTIDFSPSPGVSYDPRVLLTGGENDKGEWLSGFFDRDSFTESLAGWAKTVVVGRARLGGIPMGVVITENRASEAIKPADPADIKASEAVIQEAGCVWFPNSAYKTAQAINDFRTEDLPLMVFANWRGFSGGQRDMFDEVLKYGSLIVDAFVAYEQPIFVFIPPFAEIRGGAWVVLDSSINANVMEMYAAAGTARGGVLEANGAASVKYRTPDLVKTMHRLDDELKMLTAQLKKRKEGSIEIESKIADRERRLLPVYEQIAVQFCELHDTPGRMKAVGVIERDVEWKNARSFFYWRVRRRLAEFDLRRKIINATRVGRSTKALSGLEASSVVKEWFLESNFGNEMLWSEDKAVLSWIAQSNEELEHKILAYTRDCVAHEVIQVMTAGGDDIGTSGIIKGIAIAYEGMSAGGKADFKHLLLDALN